MVDEKKLLAEWFWTDRWMGSSAFLLPIAPRGLYREMLTQAWRRGARLPNDHEAIRRAVGCTLQEWKRYWPRIQRYWRVDGDALVNDTQLDVYQEMLDGLKRASERGTRGAQARWHKDSPSNATASPQPVLEQWPPKPTPDRSERSPSDRARGAGNRRGVGSGTFPGDHVDHVACGPVCFTPRMTAKFIGRFGSDFARLQGWARRVAEAERQRVDAGGEVLEGDDFAYWSARYTETFSESKPTPSRSVPDADATERMLADLRAHRG